MLFRSFAAATICLALVIFWVDLTELIRPLSSLSDATLHSPSRHPGLDPGSLASRSDLAARDPRFRGDDVNLCELLAECYERGDGLLLGVIAKITGVADQLQHIGVA